MTHELAGVGSAAALQPMIVCWLVVRSPHRELGRVLAVGPKRALQTIGPLTLTPGEHLLSLRSVERASSPDEEVHNGDTRFITLRFGHWQWHVLAS